MQCLILFILFDVIQERELARLRQALEACRVHDGDDFDYFPGPLTVDAASTMHEPSNSLKSSGPPASAPGRSCQTPEVIDVNPKPGEKPRIGAYIVLETITVQHPSSEVWGPQRISRNQLQEGRCPPPITDIPPGRQMPFSKPALNPNVPASNPRQLSSRSVNDSVWVRNVEPPEQPGGVSAAGNGNSAPYLRMQRDQPRDPKASAHHRHERPVVTPNGAAQDLASWARPSHLTCPSSATEGFRNSEAEMNGKASAPGMQAAPDKTASAYAPLQPREPLWVPQAFQTGSSLQRGREALQAPRLPDGNKATPNLSCINFSF